MKNVYLKSLMLLLMCISFTNILLSQCTPPPAPTNVTGTPNPFCANTTVQLNATSAGNSINWYTVPTGGVSLGTSASGANFAVIPAGTSTYYAEAVTGGGSQTFTYTGSVQTFTVPAGVTSIDIEATGGQGGGSNGGGGGLGARMIATYTVTSGQLLYIVVGQQGQLQVGGNVQNSSGGGGGTFVYDGTPTLLVAAGGGGGKCNYTGSVPLHPDAAGKVTPDGGASSDGNPGGLSGAGGNAGLWVGSPCSGGGAGWLSNGGGPYGGIGYSTWFGGAAYCAGGGGGCGGVGGFGGGGGSGNLYGGGGGGGGYSGGGGGTDPTHGGGGGSFSSGSNQNNTGGYQTGDGYVTITWAGSVCVSTSRTPVTLTASTPAAPTNVTANPNPFCLNSPVDLNGTSAGSVNWYTVPTGGVLLGTSLSGANFTVTPAGPTTYYAETVLGSAAGTQSFTYTGGVQNFTVPGGVTSIDVEMTGGSGGQGTTGIGGLGGRIQTTITVTPGQVLEIYVGGAGGNLNNVGGYNGGANTPGTNYPNNVGGGGGASDIRVSPYGLNDRIAVAGGGGGGGYNGCTEDGGAGGGLTAAGASLGCGTTAPGGGTQLGGGAGGTYSGYNAGSPGTFGFGGQGATGTSGTGGGGGYYGGGGGSWQGGGGGSNYSSGGSTTHTPGFQSGNGHVTLSWTGGGTCVSTTRTPITLTVAAPAVPTNVTATPNPYCANTTVQLNATSIGNVNWYTVPTAGTLLGTSPSGVNFPVIPAGTTTYYAETVVGGGGGGGTQTFSYTGSLQTFTVPAGITSVVITAKGAQGGAGGTAPAGSGGLGANMTGTFTVTPGQTLKVLVGQQGSGTNISAGASGGGGTFVTDNSNNPLVVAGGGGGVHGTLVTVGKDANITTSGSNGYSSVANPPYPNSYGVGGTNGNGATNGPSQPHAGNGGGLLTAGAVALCGGPGQAFVGTAAGGTACITYGGGYGGGGGDGNNGGGGGGGYSGGGGSYHTPTNGGGGGSYNGGTNQTNLVNQQGNGEVVITWAASGCVSLSRVPVTVTLDNVPPTLVWTGGTQVINLGAGCAATMPDFTTSPFALASDNCGTPTITQTPAAGSPVMGPGGVTLTATDGAGNAVTTNFAIVTADLTPPTITWTGGTQMVQVNAGCVATIPDYTTSPDVNTSDNCGTPTVTQSPPAGTQMVGSAIVMLISTDANGNMDTAYVNLVGIDNVVPVLTIPAGQTVNLDSTCSAAVPDFAALSFATDNCPGVTISQSPVPGFVITGTNTVTVIINAIDASNNVATGYVQITPILYVPNVYTNDPTTICQGSSVLLESPTMLGYTYQWYKDGVVIPGAVFNTYSATASGSYTVNITMPAACTMPSNPMVVTVVGVNATVTQNANSLTANATGAIYQWINCNMNNAPIAGATSQTFVPTSTGSYAVIVTENGCTDTSVCIEVMALGVLESNLSHQIKSYPNPTSGMVTIDLGVDYAAIEVKITSVIGALITKQDFSHSQLLHLAMPETPGTYFVNLTLTNGEKATVRVIKE